MFFLDFASSHCGVKLNWIYFRSKFNFSGLYLNFRVPKIPFKTALYYPQRWHPSNRSVETNIPNIYLNIWSQLMLAWRLSMRCFALNVHVWLKRVCDAILFLWLICVSRQCVLFFTTDTDYIHDQNERGRDETHPMASRRSTFCCLIFLVRRWGYTRNIGFVYQTRSIHFFTSTRRSHLSFSPSYTLPFQLGPTLTVV